MLNRWIRYFPVLDLLTEDRKAPILEVGSGNLGLGEFLHRPFVGCDVALDAGATSSSMRPVRGSGTDLPFRDGAFDVVLCLDTLEHVPERSRERFLDEMLRVTRNRLIIGAPMGAEARDADRRLIDDYAQGRKTAPVWLQEHAVLLNEFPMAGRFRDYFHSKGCRFTERRGEGAFCHEILSRLEDRRVTGRMTRILSRPPWRHILRPFLRMTALQGTYRTYFVVSKP